MIKKWQKYLKIAIFLIRSCKVITKVKNISTIICYNKLNGRVYE